MKDRFNQKERQDIAFRIKWKCKGCPEEVTYHDIKNNLNWSPIVSLDKGLSKTINYFKNLNESRK